MDKFIINENENEKTLFSKDGEFYVIWDEYKKNNKWYEGDNIVLTKQEMSIMIKLIIGK